MKDTSTQILEVIAEEYGLNPRDHQALFQDMIIRVNRPEGISTGDHEIGIDAAIQGEMLMIIKWSSERIDGRSFHLSDPKLYEQIETFLGEQK